MNVNEITFPVCGNSPGNTVGNFLFLNSTLTISPSFVISNSPISLESSYPSGDFIS